MKSRLKKIINSFFKKFNLQLVNRSSYKKLKNESNNYLAYSFYNICDQKFSDFFKYVNYSRSQLKQDLFVLSELGFKKKGFFVEFGATDGIRFSNTYLMETKLEWSGILCEPAKIWHSRLRVNRLGPIDTGCVWSESGKTLIFNEVVGGEQLGELSTIDSYSNNDYMSKSRKKNSRKYNVSTISLSDLLKKYEAPYEIDYLSIDTEGSEYDILKSFNFDEYNIKIITCEHNDSNTREKIFSLLSEKGYERKYVEFSRYDDWYVRK
jgi:FkbM family methyltransferase